MVTDVMQVTEVSTTAVSTSTTSDQAVETGDVIVSEDGQVQETQQQQQEDEEVFMSGAAGLKAGLLGIVGVAGVVAAGLI